jgi:hypothetical protein
MGYVFLAFSNDSRDFALHIRSRLESARISTWLREPQLDQTINRTSISMALASAAALLVVWRHTAEDPVYLAQIQHELSQARQREIPIIILAREEELESALETLKGMASLQNGGMPLPIPITEAAPLNGWQADSQSNALLFLIGGIGLIVIVGLLLVFQQPGSPLNPFTATPSPTHTMTLTMTSTLTRTATATHRPSATATSTASVTRTATSTSTPTVTSTASATRTATPTNTTVNGIVLPNSSFVTNTPSSQGG